MIYLTKIEPERNMARYYALDLQPNLFGEWSVIREWGRIGRAGQSRCTLYAQRPKAEAALGRELKRRESRNYRRVG